VTIQRIKAAASQTLENLFADLTHTIRTNPVAGIALATLALFGFALKLASSQPSVQQFPAAFTGLAVLVIAGALGVLLIVANHRQPK
jgi:hypothetical protein